MPERYIAFDVETPNFANNRMSAIGISVIESNRIIKEFFSLINPEAHFDAFNVQLTGISQEMVMDAPTFPEFWAVLEPGFLWRTMRLLICLCLPSALPHTALTGKILQTIPAPVRLAADAAPGFPTTG